MADSTIDKIKALLHKNSKSDIRDEVRADREEHAVKEAQADEFIHEREVEEHQEEQEAVTEGEPREFEPPVVIQQRGPLRARSKSLSGLEGEDSGPQPALPDMEGVTQIPESQLPVRHDRTENTALRPSDPNDPKSMDGAPDPTTAGDDRAF